MTNDSYQSLQILSVTEIPQPINLGCGLDFPIKGNDTAKTSAKETFMDCKRHNRLLRSSPLSTSFNHHVVLGRRRFTLAPCGFSRQVKDHHCGSRGLKQISVRTRSLRHKDRSAMLLAFSMTGTAVLSLRRESQTTKKKPRAPPRFTEHRSPPRQWQAVELSDSRLSDVASALAQWKARTGQTGNFLPSDSHLRRCDIARQLRLPALIARAGGHRRVQIDLGLQPQALPARAHKERELKELATILDRICVEAGLPAPKDAFPEKRTIRKLSPALGNRLAAFPGRNGYNKLAAYVKGDEAGGRKLLGGRLFGAAKGKFRFWTDPQTICSELLAYQLHPNVLPRLNTLPQDISSAIQRQGGATAFARAQGMVLEKEWANVTRFARLVRWMADEALRQSSYSRERTVCVESYMALVKEQAFNPIPFPDSARILSAGLAGDVHRYGGRKALAVRLGYDQQYGLKDTFMGPFSVQFAADVLEFASRQVDVSESEVALPSTNCFLVNQRFELLEAMTFLGGKDAVCRRVGLVPMEV